MIERYTPNFVSYFVSVHEILVGLVHDHQSAVLVVELLCSAHVVEQPKRSLVHPVA